MASFLFSLHYGSTETSLIIVAVNNQHSSNPCLHLTLAAVHEHQPSA